MSLAIFTRRGMIPAIGTIAYRDWRFGPRLAPRRRPDPKRVLRMWGNGLDTADIAHVLFITEAEAQRLLIVARARVARRAA